MTRSRIAAVVDRVERVPPSLVATVTIAALLRLYHLGEESYWLDETTTLMFVRRMTAPELFVRIPAVQPHLPLYYVVVDLWTGLVGTGEIVARFPSAVFGVATVGVVYLHGRRLSDRVGLVAALFVAVSPYHVRYGQELRMYSLLALLSVASAYALLVLFDAPTRARGAGYALLAGLLTMTHVYGFFTLAAQVLYAALRLRHEGRTTRVRVGAAVAGACALATPWALYFLTKFTGTSGVSTPNQVYHVSPPSLADAFREITHFVVWRPEILGSPGTLAIVVVFGVLVGWLVYGRPAPSTEERLWWLTFAVPVALAFVASHLVHPIYLDRYLIGASVAFFLLVGTAVRAIEPDRRRTAVVLVAVVVLAPQVATYYDTDRVADYRGMSDYLDRNADADDLVVIVDGVATVEKKPIWFYFGQDSPREVRTMTPGSTPPSASPDRTVWVVSHRRTSLHGDSVRETLSDTHDAYMITFDKLVLWRLVPKDDDTDGTDGAASVGSPEQSGRGVQDAVRGIQDSAREPTERIRNPTLGIRAR